MDPSSRRRTCSADPKRAVETGSQGGSGGGLGDIPAATVSLCDGMFASAEGLVSDRGDQSDQERGDGSSQLSGSLCDIRPFRIVLWRRYRGETEGDGYVIWGEAHEYKTDRACHKTRAVSALFIIIS